MNRKTIFLFVVLLCSILFFECASSKKNVDVARMDETQLDEAIKALSQSFKQNPNDGNIVRELGIAFYRKRDFEMAIPSFKKALALNPRDGRALFYLGTVFEIQGDIDKAIETYRQHNKISSHAKIRANIENRLNKLLLQQMEMSAKQALANEEALDPATIPANTVAVVYFKYMGKDQELEPLQKGLAELIITDLSQTDELTVIERLQMQKLLEEMGLGMTGLVDATTAPRVGKLCGAETVVNGAFVDLADKALYIDAGLVETKNGSFNATDQISGSLESFFKVEKSLVFTILDEMQIPLTQQERDRIQTIPTENLLAFLAYCKGLDYSDRGMYNEARQQFEKALDLDAKFELAGQRSEMAGAMQSDISIAEMVSIAEVDFHGGEIEAPAAGSSSSIASPSAESPAMSPADAAAGFSAMPGVANTSIMDRLQRTQTTLHMGFLPSIDSREPATEQSQQTFGNTATIEIEVRIPQE